MNVAWSKRKCEAFQIIVPDALVSRSDLFTGNDGITEGGGGDTGPWVMAIIIIVIIFIFIFTDGGAIGRYQDGLREIKEGIKHCLVVVTNQVVKLPLEDRYWVICQKS